MLHNQWMEVPLQTWGFTIVRFWPLDWLQVAESETDLKWNKFHAMFPVKLSWSKVKESTIKNCYHMCGFVHAKKSNEEDESAQGKSTVHSVTEDTQSGDDFPNLWDSTSRGIFKKLRSQHSFTR